MGFAKGTFQTAWDSQYRLNEVMNKALLPNDFGKASTMALGPTMAAVKTYGLGSSLLAAQLAESTFRSAVE